MLASLLMLLRLLSMQQLPAVDLDLSKHLQQIAGICDIEGGAAALQLRLAEILDHVGEFTPFEWDGLKLAVTGWEPAKEGSELTAQLATKCPTSVEGGRTVGRL